MPAGLKSVTTDPGVLDPDRSQETTSGKLRKIIFIACKKGQTLKPLRVFLLLPLLFETKSDVAQASFKLM